LRAESSSTSIRYTPRELEHQLSDAGARFLFVLENFAHTAQTAWATMGVEAAIIIKPGDLLGAKGLLVNFVSKYVKRAVPAWRLPGAIDFSRALAIGRRRKPTPVEVTRDDIAFLQYTGGTTGVAKGAILLHRNVAANVAQIRAWLSKVIDAPTPQTMVAALPLYHIFGLTVCCLVIAGVGGCCLLIANPRDLKSFVATLRNSRFTMISGVNTLFAALANRADFAAIDFSRLVYCVSGGMATLEVVARKWKQCTGKPIVEGYGLSETSPVLAANRSDISEFTGSIGLPIPATQISLRLADGSAAPFGERGELCAKGPQVMAGYWNCPDETAAAMTPDGFFRTGDVAVMLPDGRIKIVDRLKEMILVSGFNVYPNEVEAALALHPKVKEVAVIGMPDPHSGEAPMAFIVPADDSVTREELRAFAHENLTSYKIPRYYEFRDELPKTNVGKILRRVLREEMIARDKAMADEGRGMSVKAEQKHQQEQQQQTAPSENTGDIGGDPA